MSLGAADSYVFLLQKQSHQEAVPFSSGGQRLSTEKVLRIRLNRTEQRDSRPFLHRESSFPNGSELSQNKPGR
jgi:hypothetical protein